MKVKDLPEPLRTKVTMELIMKKRKEQLRMKKIAADEAKKKL